MAILMGKNSYGNYTKMEKEDPEERRHREAQFLIYKTMKQADQVVTRRSSKPPNWLRLRISKLKVRIGNKFLRLRKTMCSNISNTKLGVYKHFMSQLKNLKGLFHSDSAANHDIAVATTAAFGRRLPQPIFS